MKNLKTAGNVGYIRHFGQRKKGGIEEALDFRSENGWFIGREDEKKILARQLRNSWTRGAGYLANRLRVFLSNAR